MHLQKKIRNLCETCDLRLGKAGLLDFAHDLVEGLGLISILYKVLL